MKYSIDDKFLLGPYGNVGVQTAKDLIEFLSFA